MRISNLLTHLSGVRSAGRGWIARCPSHEDGSPSLSIAQGHNGKVLLKCHAGCPTEDVLNAMGLRWSDLFEGDRND